MSGESETATTNGTSTGTTTAGTGGWKPPGRAGASVGQLANVLKQGGVPQLKPTKVSHNVLHFEDDISVNCLLESLHYYPVC